MNPIDAETARPGHQAPALGSALHMHRATRLAGSRYRLRPQVIDREFLARAFTDSRGHVLPYRILMPTLHSALIDPTIRESDLDSCR